MKLERFWDNATPEPNSGCLLWDAGLAKSGYGEVRLDGKVQTAHRVAWRLTYGEIPRGLCICHKCDVRSCINPRHLFLATVGDNNRDMWWKGRGRTTGLSGAYNGNAKLTPAMVKGIWRLHNKGVIYKTIGRRYGVAQTTVSQVITGAIDPLVAQLIVHHGGQALPPAYLLPMEK